MTSFKEQVIILRPKKTTGMTACKWTRYRAMKPCKISKDMCDSLSPIRIFRWINMPASYIFHKNESVISASEEPVDNWHADNNWSSVAVSWRGLEEDVRYTWLVCSTLVLDLQEE